MDEKLYEATLRDSVDSLNELLDQDPSILDRVDTAEDTPLHLATSQGYLRFFEEILRRKPNFALVVNRQGSLPLHLACRKGQVEKVQKLLTVNPDGSLVRDGEGRTPFQIAAAKGRAEVLTELVGARPSGVRILTDRGETILHLCVKHNRFQALKQLIDTGGVIVEEIINLKDEDDNTILHLSVAQRNAEMVKLSVRRNELDVNATNLNGLTAMDFLPYEPSGTDRAIRKILRKAGGKRKALGSKQHALLSRQSKREKHEDWLMKTKGTLMIVAVLIATVTYQAGLYPPGGTLQMDVNSTSLAQADEAPSLVAYQRWRPCGLARPTRPRGLAVMAVTDPDQYLYFTVSNTIGFLSSLSIILMLVSGFPLEQKLFMRVLMVITWFAIISMAFTYGLSLGYMTICSDYRAVAWTVYWLIFMIVLLPLGHFIRFVVWLTRWLLRKLGILGSKVMTKLRISWPRAAGGQNNSAV